MAVTPPDTLLAEILDFLASTPTPETIIAFKPSDRLERRLSYLLDQNRQAALTAEERGELDECLRLNHFMNMLKIRARQKLADAAPLLAEDEEAELQALRYLSDDALWTIARERMAPEAQARTRTLMDKNSSGAITPEDYQELTRLVERGQRLMLRKSEAAAVLTRRGHTVSAQDLAARLLLV